MTRIARAAVSLIGVLVLGCAEGADDPGDASSEDVDVPTDPVGWPCAKDADCPEAGMICLGPLVSYAAGDAFMIIPSSYCTYAAGCEDDAECGPGAGCWKPLEGVPSGELGALAFDPAPLEGFGQCLMTCDGDGDCGAGTVCQMPLLRALAPLAPLDLAPSRRFCVFDDTPPCADAAERAPSTDRCLLTYALEGGFEVSDTPLGAGDIEAPIGPGTLVIDVAASDGAPAEGAAHVACFEMLQHFVVDGTVRVENALRASFVDASSASGVVAGQTLAFDECNYAATGGPSPESWTPAAGAAGPGCLEGYRTRGTVFCEGALCAAGGIQAGSNPMDQAWSQPFNDLTFADGWESVTMGGAEELLVGGELVPACPGSPGSPCPAHEAVEVPNENPSRTWLSFSGTLVDQRCGQTGP